MEALKQRVKEVLDLQEEIVYIHHTPINGKYYKITIIKYEFQEATKMIFKYIDDELAFVGGDQIHYSKCKKMEMLFKEETK